MPTESKHKAVAIDGPSGAGKSTISRIVAKKLGFIYADTGALYRAVGYYALLNSADPKSPEAVTPLLKDIRIALTYENGEQQVYVNGRNVSDEIRTPAVSMAASDVSAIPVVRQFLLDTQKRIARTSDVVMDGRDIGTVVLPNADVKIFLTADVEDRARRRFEELAKKGVNTSLENVLTQMKARDAQDSGRALAPLKPALDAILVDTTGNELEKSIGVIYSIVAERLLGL